MDKGIKKKDSYSGGLLFPPPFHLLHNSIENHQKYQKCHRCSAIITTFVVAICFLLLLIVASILHQVILHDGNGIISSKERPNHPIHQFLMRTAMFPRGGDQLALDQPWAMASLPMFESMEELLAVSSSAGSRFITGDFAYSPGLGNLMFQFAALRALVQREERRQQQRQQPKVPSYFLVLPSDCTLRRAFQLAADEEKEDKNNSKNANAENWWEQQKEHGRVVLVNGDRLRAFLAANQAALVVPFNMCCRFDARFLEPIFPEALNAASNGTMVAQMRVAIVNGYFQSHRYFHPEHRALLARKSFRFLPGVQQRAQAYLAKVLKETNTAAAATRNSLIPVLIGLHVRHGMDLTLHQRNQRHGHTVASAHFFQTAMGHFGAKFAGQPVRLVFLVASDNTAWARQNIVPVRQQQPDAGSTSSSPAEGSTVVVHFMRTGYREVDMTCLALCNHTIISTGTFGWWSAYLGGREGGGDVLYFGGWPKPNSPLDRMVNRTEYFLPEWIAM